MNIEKILENLQTKTDKYNWLYQYISDLNNQFEEVYCETTANFVSITKSLYNNKIYYTFRVRNCYAFELKVIEFSYDLNLLEESGDRRIKLIYDSIIETIRDKYIIDELELN